MGEDHESPAADALPGVLVVDDYLPNRTALRALLESIAAVTEVDSGTQAVEEIARRDYAVVVLDIRMPGMSGVEVAHLIRAGSHNAQVPIIFLTSMDRNASQILEGYAAGAVDYIYRPFDPSILKSKVAVFVELYQRREQANRQAAERARLQSERAAAEEANHQKDRFLAALSHELRTPLTSILLWSDMMLNKSLPPELARRGLQTIDLCARQEARMVDNVLEMSRLVTGKMILDPGAVDFGELVAEAVTELAAAAGERGVQVGFSDGQGRWRGVGDRARLRHALYNLLENAIKFTPEGGRADVGIDGCATGLEIRIRDTGRGFPTERAPKLFGRFEPGETRSAHERSGLGLGLAVAKALVELHGGRIAAASDGVGRGATFTITLPHSTAGVGVTTGLP